MRTLLAIRPKTLTAAMVPCLAGSALAFHFHQSFHGWILGFALLAAFFIQIGTNLVNDASDFVKGADTEDRLGPQRITQSGVLSSQTVMRLAGLCFLGALACGIPLVIHGGLPIVVIGLVSILMGYAYTAGPWPLAYHGFGDLFVILFFGLVAVNGMYYLQTLEWSVYGIWLGVQIGFHATVLIVINNLRDVEGDRKVNKKTLAVRWGLTFSKIEIAALVILPFLLNLVWWNLGLKKVAMLPMLTLPLALLIIKNIWTHSPSSVFNRFLGQSAGLHLLFGLLIAWGLWSS